MVNLDISASSAKNQSSAVMASSGVTSASADHFRRAIPRRFPPVMLWIRPSRQFWIVRGLIALKRLRNSPTTWSIVHWDGGNSVYGLGARLRSSRSARLRWAGVVRSSVSPTPPRSSSPSS